MELMVVKLELNGSKTGIKTEETNKYTRILKQ